LYKQQKATKLKEKERIMLTNTFLLTANHLTSDLDGYRFQNIPYVEWHALNDIYNANNGENWNWIYDEEVGFPWSFSPDEDEENYSNPCAEQWQGIECSCYLNLGINQKHPFGKQSDFFPPEAYYYNYYYDYSSGSSEASDPSSNDTTLPVNISCSITKFHLLKFNMKGELSPSIIYLSNLTHLMLDHNHLSGNLTYILPFLPSLTSLTLAFNEFSGTFPSSIVHLKNLENLNLEFNNFYGSLPSDLQPLTRLYLQNNDFTGLLPPSMFASPCPLIWMNLHGNHLMGTIPIEIQNCQDFFYLDFGINLFGPKYPMFLLTSLPNLGYLVSYDNSFYGNWKEVSDQLRIYSDQNSPADIFPNLVFWDIGTNHFTGEVTEDDIELFAPFYPMLDTLYIDTNQFHGSLPSNICLLKNLAYVEVPDNHFSGTVPSCLKNHTIMKELNIVINYISGTIPEEYFTDLPFLENVYMRNNLLTGTLPSTINQAEFLNEFSLRWNHLTGTIPSTVFLSSTMTFFTVRYNYLTGPVTLPSNGNHSVFPFQNEILGFLDLSENALSGSLPLNFFSSFTSLVSAFFYSNCFDSVSNDLTDLLSSVCLSKSIQSLSFDGMNSGKKCSLSRKNLPFFTNDRDLRGRQFLPSCLFSSPQLDYLSLSGIGLKGTIPSSLSTLFSSLKSLVLSHNDITGSVPSSFQSYPWELLDLSYNRIRGSLRTNTSFHPETKVYLQANRLSGSVPSVYHSEMKSLSILNGNLFTCSYSQNELPDDDPYTELYSCGTNNLNILLYLWAGILLLSVIYENIISVARNSTSLQEQWTSLTEYWKIVSLKSFEHDSQKYKGSSFFLYYVFLTLQVVRSLFILLSGYYMTVLMVIYGILGIYYKSHQFTYAFVLSGAFFSGTAPTVVFYIAWVLVILSVDITLHYFNKYHHTQSGGCDKQQPKTSTRKLNLQNVEFWKPLFGLFVISCMLFVSIILLNIGFLYTQTHFSLYYQVLSQCAMSSVKIAFSRIIIPFALSWIFSFFLEVDIWTKSPPSSTSAGNSLVSPAQERKLKQEWCYYYQLILEILFGLLINIIAPCIATAIYDINCFYNMVFDKPPMVMSEFVINGGCFNRADNGSTLCIAQPIQYESSYQPLFSYSYQCSSILLTNYLFVFVFMILSDQFVKPNVKWAVVKWKERREIMKQQTVTVYPLTVPTEEPKEDREDGKSKNMEDVEVHSERLAEPIQNVEKNALAKSKSVVLSVKETSFLVLFLNYFSILITFGLMFPPLGLFILLYLVAFVTSYLKSFEKFFVGIASELRDSQEEITAPSNLLLQAVVKLSEKKFHCCLSLLIVIIQYIIIPFTLLFMHYFLFDMLGDEVGWEIAMIVTVLTFIFCLFCHYSFLLFSYHSFLSDSQFSKLSNSFPKKSFQAKSIVVKSKKVMPEGSGDDAVNSDDHNSDEEDDHFVVVNDKVDDVELALKLNDCNDDDVAIPEKMPVQREKKRTEFRRTALVDGTPAIGILRQTVELERIMEQLELDDKYFDSTSDVLTMLIEFIIAV
jgi:Leucine-rich repeat (LRR) protein